MQHVSRPMWITLGLAALALGAAGVVLPLLPTTPFVLLAAYCFAKSSPRLHDWLVKHRLFGPLIENWERHGAISPRAKTVAVATMVATPVVTLLIGAPPWALVTQIVVLMGAATFVLTRPSGPAEEPTPLP